MVAILTNVAGRLKALAGVQSSAGAADAGKVPVLAADGRDDGTFAPGYDTWFLAGMGTTSFTLAQGYNTIPMNVVSQDRGSNFNASSYSYKAPKAGIYFFGGAALLPTPPAGTYSFIFAKNGTAVLQPQAAVAPGNYDVQLSGSGFVLLNSGDLISIQIYALNSGGVVNQSPDPQSTAYTFFNGLYVSA